MSPDQYTRWKDFSTRMARYAFSNATAARRTKLEESVRQFFYTRYDDHPDRIKKIIDWDRCAYDASDTRRFSDYSVGDEVSMFLDPHYHEKEFADRRVEPRGNKFENQVSCCIRAGLDIASSPSGGVLGFTVGNLRTMYPEGLPDWVATSLNPPITPQTADDCGVWL